ncbi:MAG TPA: ABC transporter ATP-binding protein [Myxococcaceae bacterium]|nr:ABC transporter ATP-binding protein [Myxococcaceae bacterium]
MAEVVLSSVEKRFGEVTAVAGVDLIVRDREFVILVGPSGCGKTTTLRMIAGLEDVSGGDISIGGKSVTHLPPKDRDIAMVFQSYALYPHMTVYRNMAFSLQLRRMPKPEIDKRVREAASILGLADLLNRKPRALSGGQRQRVAVGAALCRQAGVLLFDEPLSNLDAKLRVHMRTELKRLHQSVKSTMIYVTHDQVEAMTMGDRIVIMDKGKICQVATPLEAYRTPANRFVAGFIGTPPMNFYDGELRGEGASLMVVLGGDLTLPVPRPRLSGVSGRPVTMGIRPEHIQLGGEGNGTRVKVPATIEVVEPLGNEAIVTARCAAGLVQIETELTADLKPGQAVPLLFDTAQVHLFDRQTELAL